MNNTIKLDYRIVIITIILCCLHAIIVTSPIFSGIVSICEAVICIFSLLKKRIDDFLFVVMIIVITSFDTAFFAIGDVEISVYSIVMMPVLKGYFFFLLSLIPLFLIYVKDGFKWVKKLHNKSALFFIYRFAILSIFIGILFGIISIIFNDNNIREMNYFKYFSNELIRLSIFSLYIIYFIYLHIINFDFPAKLKKYSFSILSGLIISAFFSIISNKKGYYGDNEIVLMPLSFFYSTLICLFLFYKEYKNKIVISILAFLSLFMQVFYSNALNGKSWLAIAYILFAIIIILFQRGKKIILLFLFVCFILFSASVYSLLENQKSGESVSSSKLSQALSLISVIDMNWYEYLPDSPKIRIEEILNTTVEYCKKPYFLITGKGYGGSIKDHRNAFGYYIQYAFSIDEYNHNTFVAMHETVATIFLKFGLWGILSFLYIVYRGLGNFSRNPWSIIGILWFLFFVGYSFSLALFGIPSLVSGLYKPENETK